MSTTTREGTRLIICATCEKGGRGSCGGICVDGWLRQETTVRRLWADLELVGIRDTHDITKPPSPESKPVRCTAGCDDGLVDIPRMVIGPVLGTPLAPGETSTLLRPSKCRPCMGRGWLWGVE